MFHAKIEFDVGPVYEVLPHIPEYCSFRLQTHAISFA